jgi:tRNA pseudouridine55 synthase
MFGLLNIDKPRAMTSRDIVNGVQRLVRPHKVGHAGTLDPLATGVLVLCLGKATRLIEYVQQPSKRYLAEFQLGQASDTEDIEGQVWRCCEEVVPTLAEMEAVIPRFVGEIEQRPPAFSALKVQGERAYRLARRGEAVDLAPRRIKIHSLTLVQYDYPQFVLAIECGSGTYVRSLGRDMARSVGSAAVMTSLRRLAVGGFRVEDSVPYDLLHEQNITAHLLPATRAVEHLAQITLSAAECTEISHGRRIANRGSSVGGEVAAVSAAGELLAIMKAADNDWLKPKRVFL